MLRPSCQWLWVIWENQSKENLYNSTWSGYPDNSAWSGPGSVSTLDYVRTQLRNIIYQMIIKPYFFSHPQLEQFRKALYSQMFKMEENKEHCLSTVPFFDLQCKSNKVFIKQMKTALPWLWSWWLWRPGEKCWRRTLLLVSTAWPSHAKVNKHS